VRKSGESAYEGANGVVVGMNSSTSRTKGIRTIKVEEEGEGMPALIVYVNRGGGRDLGVSFPTSNDVETKSMQGALLAAEHVEERKGV